MERKEAKMKWLMATVPAAVVALGMIAGSATAQVSQADGVIGVFNRMIRQGSGSVDSIATELMKIVDVERVTTRVLGKNASRMTAEQRERFDAAFVRMVAADLSQIAGMSGARIEIEEAGASRALSGGQIAQPVVIRNDAVGAIEKGGAILGRGGDGNLRLIDVELSGVSVIGRHTDAVMAMWQIANGDPEVLIRAMEESVRAVAVSGSPVGAGEPVMPAPVPQVSADTLPPLMQAAPVPIKPVTGQSGQPEQGASDTPLSGNAAPVQEAIPAPEQLAPPSPGEGNGSPVAAPSSAPQIGAGAAVPGSFVQPRAPLAQPFQPLLPPAGASGAPVVQP